MNTATQIKAANTIYTEQGYKMCVNSIMVEAEELAQRVEQDWDLESTMYYFPDGSCMLVCGSDVSTFGVSE